MDNIPVELLPKSDHDRFLHVPHKDRWEHLKPVIVQLYTGKYGKEGKSLTVQQVAEFMRTHYSFHAAPTEYPHRFRAWNVTKRVVKDLKDDITSALGRRKRPGTSTAQVNIQQGDRDVALEVTKLRRYLKDRKPRRVVEALPPGLLSSWNLPYEAFIRSLPKQPDRPSPFGQLHETPPYLDIRSPAAVTPGRVAPGPSPNMELVYQKAREDRSSLFIQGRLDDLMISMCKEDRSVFVDYFHNFYIHGFVMARGWGSEPSAGVVTHSPQFIHHNRIPASPATARLMDTTTIYSSPGQSEGADITHAPTQLCRWSIHVEEVDYEEEDTMPSSMPTTETPRESFVTLLHQSIVSGNFTDTSTGDLPFAKEAIVQSLEAHPTVLQLDAWKFAIMAGKTDLLEELYHENGQNAPEDIDAIHPFHLAASFLDGGTTCCMMFETLHSLLGTDYTFRHNVDNLGHTILDAFMVSILRSHTRLSPELVSDRFRATNRFPGEECDICGRWTADDPMVRELFKQGDARVPPRWKHMFCHTAVQAVCHGIIAVYASPIAPNINAPSGLFVRRCTECGMELKLGPLHTLVVTAFYLAHRGTQGETLFGALAVAVCLLALGADVTLNENISIEEILRTSETGTCSHASLTALDLMRAVPGDIIGAWSEECQTGWACLLEVLAGAHRDREESSHSHGPLETPKNQGWDGEDTDMNSDDSSVEEECALHPDFHEPGLRLQCYDNPKIGLIWATIQTEFLTYRRLKIGDAWLSENFSMKALQAWLSGESLSFQTPLAQNGMMKKHSKCGWFSGSGDSLLSPTAPDVCEEHFMNMDDYSRMTFLSSPDLLDLWNDVEWRDDI